VCDIPWFLLTPLPCYEVLDKTLDRIAISISRVSVLMRDKKSCVYRHQTDTGEIIRGTAV